MWRALTTDDLLGSITKHELAAFQRTAQAGGGSDPIAMALTRATADVRGAVGSNEQNRLGPDGTIPTECLSAAADLAAFYIVSSNGLAMNDSMMDVRRKKQEDALKFLDKVASGKRRVVPPDETAPKQPSGPGVVEVVKAARATDTKSLSGLL